MRSNGLNFGSRTLSFQLYNVFLETFAFLRIPRPSGSMAHFAVSLVFWRVQVHSFSQFSVQSQRASMNKPNRDERISGRKKRKGRNMLHKEEEDRLYEVEKIVDCKIVKGHLRYRIRWKGYSEEDDTWEKSEDTNCPDLIKEFHDGRILEVNMQSRKCRRPIDVNIIDCVILNEQLFYLVQESGRLNLCKSDFVRSHFPSQLIKFFERHQKS